ncbi:hypothetical protein B0H67DRAFT_97036, partial [Lasiosphaeris hirsuta]
MHFRRMLRRQPPVRQPPRMARPREPAPQRVALPPPYLRIPHLPKIHRAPPRKPPPMPSPSSVRPSSSQRPWGHPSLCTEAASCAQNRWTMSRICRSISATTLNGLPSSASQTQTQTMMWRPPGDHLTVVRSSKNAVGRIPSSKTLTMTTQTSSGRLYSLTATQLPRRTTSRSISKNFINMLHLCLPVTR